MDDILQTIKSIVQRIGANNTAPVVYAPEEKYCEYLEANLPTEAELAAQRNAQFHITPLLQHLCCMKGQSN